MHEQFPIGATCNTLHRLDRCPLKEKLDSAVGLLHDLAKCYEEDTGSKLDVHDQDTTQYAVWLFLTSQPRAPAEPKEQEDE